MPSDRVHQRLVELSRTESVIKLNSSTFKDLAESHDTRTFSTVVLFTALRPTTSCPVCPFVADAFQRVVDVYRASEMHTNNALLFASIDFADEPEIFDSFRIKSVPWLMHLPAHSAPDKHDIYLITEAHSTTAMVISKWIEYRTGIALSKQPSESVQSGALIVVTALLVAASVYQRFSTVAFANKRETVATILVAFCITMAAGNVWNYVRSAPLLAAHEKHGILFMHPSMESQLCMESHMVMFICESN